MELDIAYFLEAYPTFYCAVCNQLAHTTSCSVSCGVSSHAGYSPQKWGKMMNKAEQEALRKILVALFLEHPRGGTKQALHENQEEIRTKTSPNVQPTRSQQLGGEKHGR